MLIIKPNYWAKKDIISLFGNYFKPSAVKRPEVDLFPRIYLYLMPFKSLVRLNDQACFQPSKIEFLSSRRQSKIITHAHLSDSSWRQKIESFGRRQSHLGIHRDNMSWIHLKLPVVEMEGLIFALGKLWALLGAELSPWCWWGHWRMLCHRHISFMRPTSSRKLLLRVIILGKTWMCTFKTKHVIWF